VSGVVAVGQRLRAPRRHWHDAPLRTRLTAAAALAAMVSIVGVISVAYVAVHHELLGNIDSQLRKQAPNVQLVVTGTSGKNLIVGNRNGPGMVPSDVQGILLPTNDANDYLSGRPNGQAISIPITARDRQIAAGHGGEWLHTTDFQGTPLRVDTLHVPFHDLHSGQVYNGAVQVALPLTAVESQLHRLRLAFLLLALLGLGAVVAGSWLAVRRMMRPVASLTEAAEQIAVTRDLATRIEDYGDDELGRLAVSFNTMLDALERSLGSQRQLILDASHELRTPLASLRTNVEVLHEIDRLTLDQRHDLLDGIVTQLEELTGLVADVVELARGDAPESAHSDVEVDELVSHTVERARRYWPNVVYMLTTEPLVVRGVSSRLDRAVINLLDNAGKFSAAGAVVDVAVTSDGTISVADRGPGVPEDALPFVFDRFYRSDEARAMPGSGLGLAIVKQVVDGHGGTVTMANRLHGGAVVTVTLVPLPLEEPVSASPEVEPAPQTVAG
jgi:two-component system, OmpR family, sensor histidine kinase MprB